MLKYLKSYPQAIQEAMQRASKKPESKHTDVFREVQATVEEARKKGIKPLHSKLFTR